VPFNCHSLEWMISVLTKIDWISFSVHLPARGSDDERVTEQAIIEELYHMWRDLPALLHFGDMQKRSKGRAPYSVSWHLADNGITVMYHPRLNHALIEISGKGCDLLEDDGTLKTVLEVVAQRVTRIDLACDMLCDERPTAFAENRTSGRFKSHSSFISESGETYYVGARESNRYARVYRWEPPHERSPFLRVEYVLKAEDAKLAADYLLQHGTHDLATDLGKRFGWLSENWKPLTQSIEEFQAYRAERKEGKTLFWLGDTVAPLLLRLHREGTIDIDRWFKEFIESRMDAEEMAARGKIPF